MSDTPRTDAECMSGETRYTDMVHCSFAQELELELYEECRLNGMGSEREAALKDRVRQLEDQLQVAMWCLDKAKEREQKHIGQWTDPR